MRKSTGGATAASELVSLGITAARPEQNGAGGSGGASPKSFTNGSYFFNSPGNFFAGTGQSFMAQPWMMPQSSDPATWDKNPAPPAKEQKEAAEAQREARKLEVEARMFETYNRLLAIDVALMSDEVKLEHTNTMKCLKKKLFCDYN